MKAPLDIIAHREGTCTHIARLLLKSYANLISDIYRRSPFPMSCRRWSAVTSSMSYPPKKL